MTRKAGVNNGQQVNFLWGRRFLSKGIALGLTVITRVVESYHRKLVVLVGIRLKELNDKIEIFTLTKLCFLQYVDLCNCEI